MHIDRLSHLTFPPEPGLQAGRHDTAGTRDAGVAAVAAPKRQAAQPAPASAAADSAPASGVLLKLSLPGEGQASPVYGPARKGLGAEHAQAHAQALAQVQQPALSEAGNAAHKSQGSVNANQAEFVTLAVSAMRSFSEAQALQPAAASASDTPSASPLRGLQQLAAKFKLFS